jgi:hypothetical protein
MLTPDDFNYALENTRVVLEPRHRLATFGSSLLNYYLITEDMDAGNLSRVREGQIQADKPQIINPHHFAKLLLEGFGEKANDYAESISAHASRFAFLKYGFQIRKAEFRTYDVHQALAQVVDNVVQDVTQKDDPFSAVITGIDDGWEVSLLKFTLELIQRSAGDNLQDFRNRGLL